MKPFFCLHHPVQFVACKPAGELTAYVLTSPGPPDPSAILHSVAGHISWCGGSWRLSLRSTADPRPTGPRSRVGRFRALELGPPAPFRNTLCTTASYQFSYNVKSLMGIRWALALSHVCTMHSLAMLYIVSLLQHPSSQYQVWLAIVRRTKVDTRCGTSPQPNNYKQPAPHPSALR